MTQPIFRFAPRWKEELVVTADQGSFVLPFWMGRPTVELPSEAHWPVVAPLWAADHWQPLHRALELWCQGNGAALEVSEKGMVW